MIQRRRHRERDLRADRVALLEALAPTWKWEPQASRWESALAHLRTYVSHHGNASVASDYVTEDGFKLGAWVSRRRHDYGQGSLSNVLTTNRFYARAQDERSHDPARARLRINTDLTLPERIDALWEAWAAAYPDGAGALDPHRAEPAAYVHTSIPTHADAPLTKGTG